MTDRWAIADAAINRAQTQIAARQERSEAEGSIPRQRQSSASVLKSDSAEKGCSLPS